MTKRDHEDWMRRSDALDRKMRIVTGAAFVYLGLFALVSMVGATVGVWDWQRAGDVWFSGVGVMVIVAAIGGGIYLLSDRDRDLW